MSKVFYIHKHGVSLLLDNKQAGRRRGRGRAAERRWRNRIFFSNDIFPHFDRRGIRFTRRAATATTNVMMRVTSHHVNLLGHSISAETLLMLLFLENIGVPVHVSCFPEWRVRKEMREVGVRGLWRSASRRPRRPSVRPSCIYGQKLNLKLN